MKSAVYPASFLLLTLDNHDIISVETRTIYSLPINDPGRPANQRVTQTRKEKWQNQPKNLPKGDSFGMALLRVIGVFVIMGLLYFGWTAYRVRHADRF